MDRHFLSFVTILALFSGIIFTASGKERMEIAARIRDSKQIELATAHVSGKTDDATAKQNIVDTAKGMKAKRSSYENAPGGSIDLGVRMLMGMFELAKSFRFRVSEIAGGSHSKDSRHYAGVAFDVDQIDGQAVNKDHASYKKLMEQARKLGATEVLGPGDKGHDHHVHIAWPRP